MAQWLTNPNSIHKDADSWPRSLGERSGVAVSCGVGHRLGSDQCCCGCGVGYRLQL